MNLFQFNTVESINDLNIQLSHFGLQPGEWSVVKNANQRFLIQHKEDKSFYFIGETKIANGRKQWKHIQLVSI